MYSVATDFEELQPSLYPFVTGESDERAARGAYCSVNHLLDYRAKQFPDAPFLCPFDLENDSYEEITFGDTRRFVIAFAKRHSQIRGVRQKGEKGKVVGIIGPSDADHWLNDKAIQRL